MPIQPVGEFTVDLSDLRRFGKQVDEGLRSGSGPFADMYTQWAARWRAFVQERYDRFSRGGGDWPPFSPNTRRKRGSMENAKLLRDTNTMFAALNPQFSGAPGQYQQQIDYGVEVGFGGAAMHPSSASSGGRATVAQIAEYHHTGAGHLPVRTLVVPPDEHLLGLMASDAERAMMKAANNG